MENGGVRSSATKTALIQVQLVTGAGLPTFEREPKKSDIYEMTSRQLSVPLILEDPVRFVKDNATPVAGMLGFTVHTGNRKEISVQPFQG